MPPECRLPKPKPTLTSELTTIDLAFLAASPPILVESRHYLPWVLNEYQSLPRIIM
jgi:hypothetical protein